MSYRRLSSSAAIVFAACAYATPASAQTGFAATFGAGAISVDIGEEKGKFTMPAAEIGLGYTFAGMQDKDFGFSAGGYGTMLMFYPLELQNGARVGVGAPDFPFEIGLGMNVNVRVKQISGGFVIDSRRISRGTEDEPVLIDFGDIRDLLGMGFSVRGTVNRTGLQFEYIDYGTAGTVETVFSRENGEQLESGRRIRVSVMQFISSWTALKFEYTETKLSFERTGQNAVGQLDHRGRLISGALVLMAF